MKSKYLPVVHFSLKAEPADYVLQNLKYHPAGWESATTFFSFLRQIICCMVIFVNWSFFLFAGLPAPLKAAPSCGLVRFMAWDINYTMLDPLHKRGSNPEVYDPVHKFIYVLLS